MIRFDNDTQDVLQKDELIASINDILNAFALVSPDRFKSKVRGVIGVETRESFERDGVSYLLLVFNDLDSRLYFDSHKEVVESTLLRPDLVNGIHTFLFEKIVIPLIWPRLRARKYQTLEHGSATFSRLNQGIGVTATVAVPNGRTPDDIISETSSEVWNILDSIYVAVFPKMATELSVYLNRIRNGHCISCNMQGPPLCQDCC